MRGLTPNHIFVENKTGVLSVILVDYIVPFPNWILVTTLKKKRGGKRSAALVDNRGKRA